MASDADAELEAELDDLLVAESGRWLGRAELLAKKGASGRMQRPPELVPIPKDPLVRREGFGKLRKVAAFWKNPENFGQHSAKF